MTVQGNNGSGNDDNDNNIIKMPDRAERAKAERVRVKVTMGHHPNAPKPDHPPMINLPTMTKILVMTLLGIHVVVSILNPEQRFWIIEHFGFVPAYYTAAIPFDWPALIGPITYSFVHGSWMHVIMNAVMLMAFGAGLERWMGWKRLAVFMMGCNIVAILIHLGLNIGSDDPVVGASGALSGMFSAVIMVMQAQSGFLGQGKYRYLPLIGIWIGVSLLFGVLGGPGGENIAWAAHIGGFLAGFVLFKPVMRLFR